jgi:hypothetical protein
MLGSKKYLDPKYAVLGIFVCVVCLTLVAFDLSVYGSSNNNDDNNNDGLPYCDQIGPGYRGSCFDGPVATCDLKDGSQVYDYRDCPDRGERCQ